MSQGFTISLIYDDSTQGSLDRVLYSEAPSDALFNDRNIFELETSGTRLPYRLRYETVGS